MNFIVSRKWEMNHLGVYCVAENICLYIYPIYPSWCNQAEPDPRKKKDQDRHDNSIFMIWVELPTASTMLGVATTVLSDYYELAVGVS